jgi:hypothetical protein
MDGSPNRRTRAEPPSAPLTARRPAEFIVTGDRQFDPASSARSRVQTRSRFYRYPFCRWPARFSGLDFHRGRCLAETPAERLRFSGGRDSETGSGPRSHVALLRMLAFRVGRRVRISFPPADSPRLAGYSPPTSRTPAFRAGVRAMGDGAVSRDGHRPAMWLLPPTMSLLGQILVPQCRRCRPRWSPLLPPGNTAVG